MTVKPVSPDELGKYKAEIFPEFVLKAFNDLLAEKYAGYSVTIRQNEAIDRILQYSEDVDVDRAMIFSRGWLNIEEIYREVGWSVSYDKPGYCEDYEAYFTFKKKK